MSNEEKFQNMPDNVKQNMGLNNGVNKINQKQQDQELQNNNDNVSQEEKPQPANNIMEEKNNPEPIKPMDVDNIEQQKEKENTANENNDTNDYTNQSNQNNIKSVNNNNNNNIQNQQQSVQEKSNEEMGNMFDSMDLSDVEIKEKSPFQKFDDIQNVFKNDKSAFQIGCIQSGYIAEMSALSMGDINRMINSKNDPYMERKHLYKTIYEHIENTSLGQVRFNDWLKMTSFDDLDTLLYGVYSQTFPDENEFTITCPHCEKKIDIVVDNNHLVQIENDGITDKMRELLTSQHSGVRDLIEKSLVHSTLRTRLPESKIIIDLTTPSLDDHLSMLEDNQELLEDNSEEAIMLMYTDQILIPDIKTSRRKGKPVYTKVEDVEDQISILEGLSIKDGKHLTQKFNKRIEQYRIHYQIKDYECDKCHEMINNIPVNIESALFTQIVEVYQDQ